MADQQKLDFILNDFAPLLKQLNANAEGKWGKMNAQQMTEHVADFFKVSSGQLVFPLVSPPEYLPKLKAFLLSDKEFRENTKAPEEIVPEDPKPERNSTYTDAIKELEDNIQAFVAYYNNPTTPNTTHPVFGELNFDEWVLLHYKHVTHHAKQFGLI